MLIQMDKIFHVNSNNFLVSQNWYVTVTGCAKWLKFGPTLNKTNIDSKTLIQDNWNITERFKVKILKMNKELLQNNSIWFGFNQ